MDDKFAPKSLSKRKNMKKLQLSAPTPKNLEPSAGDSQIPGGIGNEKSLDTLEIGVEFQLNLKTDDEFVVMRELGAGNGGTVSKVMHPATKIIMARKVGSSRSAIEGAILIVSLRSFTSRLKSLFVRTLFGSYTS
jgi:mitogen-activated protein kinase kinase